MFAYRRCLFWKMESLTNPLIELLTSPLKSCSCTHRYDYSSSGFFSRGKPRRWWQYSSLAVCLSAQACVQCSSCHFGGLVKWGRAVWWWWWWSVNLTHRQSPHTHTHISCTWKAVRDEINSQQGSVRMIDGCIVEKRRARVQFIAASWTDFCRWNDHTHTNVCVDTISRSDIIISG